MSKAPPNAFASARETRLHVTANDVKGGRKAAQNCRDNGQR